MPKKTLALLTALAFVTACETKHYVIGGALIGGTSGGMIGNQIDDDGAGLPLGAITGVLIGAFLGLCVGFSKEEPDNDDD